MAKLAARGRKEVVRVEREVVMEADKLIDWGRKTYALMSDGTILEKYDVHFKPDQFRPSGEKHSYGWKVFKKVKPEVTAERFVEHFTKQGYVRA